MYGAATAAIAIPRTDSAVIEIASPWRASARAPRGNRISGPISRPLLTLKADVRANVSVGRVVPEAAFGRVVTAPKRVSHWNEKSASLRVCPAGTILPPQAGDDTMNGLKILGIAAIMFAVMPGSALPKHRSGPMQELLISSEPANFASARFLLSSMPKI